MSVAARKHPCQVRLSLILVGTLACLSIGLIAIKALFPLTYEHDIMKWSTVYCLEPAWVAAIIHCESRFRPTAISPSGAIGLMQIMPTTGIWIAEQLGWPNPASVPLDDASTSIALGTWYLRHLLDRFATADAALMAYNAGPTNASRWEGDLKQAFAATQRYIRRIHRSFPIYSFYFRALWLVDLIPSPRLFY